MSYIPNERQEDAILRVLVDAAGAWVPLPQIIMAQGSGRIIGQYNARIYGLRRRGHEIENRKKRVVGRVHSEYRLIPKAGQLSLGGGLG